MLRSTPVPAAPALNAAVLESWCAASEGHDSASGQRLRVESARRRRADAAAAADSLVARQKERHRLQQKQLSRARAAAATTDELEAAVERECMQQRLQVRGWKHSSLASAEAGESFRAAAAAAPSHSMHGSVTDQRPVEAPAALSKTLQHILSHANTRLNDTVLQDAWRALQGEQVLPPSLPASGVAATAVSAVAQRALITTSNSNYRVGEEKDGWSLPHSGLATMLREQQQQQQQQRPGSAPAAHLHSNDARSRPYSAKTTSLAKKLSDLEALLMKTRSRSTSASSVSGKGSSSVSESTPPPAAAAAADSAFTRPTPDSIAQLIHNRKDAPSVSHYSAVGTAGHLDAADEVVRQMLAAGSNEKAPLHLIDNISVAQVLLLLNYPSMPHMHEQLVKYVHELSVADSEAGVNAKADEWQALMEDIAAADAKQFIRHSIAACAYALQDYQKEAEASEEELNRLHVLDAAANRVRADTHTLLCNLRADMASRRFHALVFIHLHKLFRVPGPCMELPALQAYLSMSAVASSNRGRHGRVVARQKKLSAPKLSTRPVSAPMQRRRAHDQRVIQAIAAASGLSDANSAAVFNRPSSAIHTSSHRGTVPARPASAIQAKSNNNSNNSEAVSVRPPGAPVRPASADANNLSSRVSSPAVAASKSVHRANRKSHAAHQPLSALMNPALASELLQQLNTISSDPKQATAFPSHLSADAFETLMEANIFAQPSPLEAAYQQRYEQQRDAERAELEWHEAQLSGRVSHVSNELTRRQVQLSKLHSQWQEERSAVERSLQVEQLERQIIFERLEEEFEEQLELEEQVVIQRNRVEEVMFEAVFPTSLVQAVRWPRAAADTNAVQQSTATDSTPSMPVALSQPPTERFQQSLLVGASRPVRQRYVDAPASDAAVGFSSLSSTAPEVFPSFAHVSFRLQQFKIPLAVSPPAPVQHFAQAPLTLLPTIAAFDFASFRSFSTVDMPLPPSMGATALLDEHFDAALLSAGASEAATIAAATVSFPRTRLDFGLLTRVAREKYRAEQLQLEQKRRKLSYRHLNIDDKRPLHVRLEEVHTNMEAAVKAKVHEAQLKAKEAADAVAAAMRSTVAVHATSSIANANESVETLSAAHATVDSASSSSLSGSLTANEFVATHQRWIASSSTSEPLFKKRSPRGGRWTAASDESEGDEGDEEKESRSSEEEMETMTDNPVVAPPFVSTAISDAGETEAAGDEMRVADEMDDYLSHSIHVPTAMLTSTIVATDAADPFADVLLHSFTALQPPLSTSSDRYSSSWLQRHQFKPEPSAEQIAQRSTTDDSALPAAVITAAHTRRAPSTSPAAASASATALQSPLLQWKNSQSVVEAQSSSFSVSDVQALAVAKGTSKESSPVTSIRITAAPTAAAIVDDTSSSFQNGILDYHARLHGHAVSEAMDPSRSPVLSPLHRFGARTAKTVDKQRIRVEQQATLDLQTRLLRVWSNLQLTAQDMLQMLEKYSSAASAVQLSTALTLWEKCANFYRSRHALLQRCQTALSTHQRGLAVESNSKLTVIHQAGGVDGHGQLLAVTWQTALACQQLFLSHGDIIHVDGVPLLQALLADIQWRCCSDAVQVREDILMLQQKMQEQQEEHSNKANAIESVVKLTGWSEEGENTIEKAMTPLTVDSASASNVPVYRRAPNAAEAVASSTTSAASTRFVKPPVLLHPRPLIPGEFMALIRGSSVLQLPPSSPTVVALTVRTAAINRQQQQSLKSSKQTESLTARRPQSAMQTKRAKSGRAITPASSAALAAQLQSSVNNKHWNLFT